MPSDDPAPIDPSIARWPPVPRCTDWLALDERGRWWLRDHAGPLPWPRDARGRLDKHGAGPVLHAGLAAFIGRHYRSDEDGAWYVQNGPQRVDVTLEAAPWILRLDITDAASWVWQTHAGLPCRVDAAWTDAAGRIWLRTDVGPALLHSNDVPAFAAQLDPENRAPAASGLPAVTLPDLPGSPAQFFGFRPDPGR